MWTRTRQRYHCEYLKGLPDSGLPKGSLASQYHSIITQETQPTLSVIQLGRICSFVILILVIFRTNEPLPCKVFKNDVIIAEKKCFCYCSYSVLFFAASNHRDCCDHHIVWHTVCLDNHCTYSNLTHVCTSWHSLLNGGTCQHILSNVNVSIITGSIIVSALAGLSEDKPATQITFFLPTFWWYRKKQDWND